MRRIATEDDLCEALDALCRHDPRFANIRAAAGAVPLRRSPPGFATLASVVVAQQVSRASAAAIFARLARLIDPLTPAAVAAASEAVHREAGLSRAKQRTLTAIAGAVLAGLDLERLCELDAEPATALLTAIPGVGPWTAQCYLLFGAGHPDVFPAGDVALQSAAGWAFGIAPRPGARQLAQLAEAWSPWRGAAARLLWAYYAAVRGREAAPLGSALEESAGS